jgi:hypothetical protein
VAGAIAASLGALGLTFAMTGAEANLFRLVASTLLIAGSLLYGSGLLVSFGGTAFDFWVGRSSCAARRSIDADARAASRGASRRHDSPSERIG